MQVNNLTHCTITADSASSQLKGHKRLQPERAKQNKFPPSWRTQSVTADFHYKLVTSQLHPKMKLYKQRQQQFAQADYNDILESVLKCVQQCGMSVKTVLQPGDVSANTNVSKQVSLINPPNIYRANIKKISLRGSIKYCVIKAAIGTEQDYHNILVLTWDNCLSVPVSHLDQSPEIWHF